MSFQSTGYCNEEYINNEKCYKMVEFNELQNAENFYKTYVKSKRSKNASTIPAFVSDGVNSADTTESIAGLFNNFFTNIKSASVATENESEIYIKDIFNELKQNKLLNTPKSGFSFSKITLEQVLKAFEKISSSSLPGFTGIPTKILLNSLKELSPFLLNLFNSCIETGTIPDEWKYSIVLPLFKNKGKSDDCNNYRGISLLSPIAKIFETILAEQVSFYFESNNLFHPSQHGFRKNYSCESALHEIISELNDAKDKRLIALLLFIDFRKAFDTVDSKLLINKLFHYGFDNLSLKLITNYFEGRSQLVRLNDFLSTMQLIKLGVPQGSVFGPLLFLIFINDLAFLLALACKLFADDTTIYEVSQTPIETLENVILKFKIKLHPLLKWCKFNRMDINWSKTFFMIVTAKHKSKMMIPTSIEIDSHEVAVTDSFKLLGVLIDNDLTFNQHIVNICKNVNMKLFSIKKLAYLPFVVRLQFFKTFILPLFDYCLSLIIYFSKTQIQKLSNCYYACLYKLFRFDFTCKEMDEINIALEKYHLFGFQHRVVLRLCLFGHKIENVPSAPPKLKEQLLYSTNRNIQYSFRKTTMPTLFIPKIKTHYGEKTFKYFFNKFLEKTCIVQIKLSFIDFRKHIISTINSICTKFTQIFENFDISYKKFCYIHYGKRKNR